MGFVRRKRADAETMLIGERLWGGAGGCWDVGRLSGWSVGRFNYP